MTQKNTDSAAPRKPLRSIPWWLLGGLVLLMVLGIWIGTRWGTQIGTGVSTMTSFLSRSDAQGGDTEHDSDGPTQYYTCGMHPSVILPEPGDCPICSMPLTPLDPSKFTGEMMIDPVVVQNIGVRIEPVAEGPLVRTIRTVGMVDYDETRVRDINTKLSCWIEKLFVDYEGVAVEAGDPLFEIYSPELLAAEEEYLLALRAQEVSNGQQGNLDLVGSARMKLELFDITPKQIDALAASGKAERTMMLLSPHTGIVIAKHANEGMKITPGMQVFRIADLSKVWALVTLYESQLPFISLGQNAVMSLPYIPGHTFEGKVVYIYPYLDTKTREVQVRLEFDNTDGLLMPGMFATVELQSTLRQRATLAPREAVISTGTRDVAFVSLGEGKFEPRDIKLGVETGTGEVEILDGLVPGELVVTSGQFLIDSESRVREALAKMIRGEMASDQIVQAASAGSSEIDAMPDAMATGLAAALDAYFAIGNQLANDTPSGIDDPARDLAAALDSVIGIDIPGNEHFWHNHTEAATIRGSALEIIGSTDLAMAREHFGDISVAMDTLLRATGIPPGYATPVQSLHCPMFREGQGGGIWLQPEGPVRNPFFGSMMLRCYDGRETIPVTGQDAEDKPAADAGEQATPAETVSVSADQQAAIDSTIEAYLRAQDHLTRNEVAEAGEALASVQSSAELLKAAPGAVGESAGTIAEAFADLPADLEAQREAFAVASDALLELLTAAPPSSAPSAADDQAGLFHAYCPMVDEDWLQIGEKVRNPYNPNMLSCGIIKSPVQTHATMHNDGDNDQ